MKFFTFIIIFVFILKNSLHSFEKKEVIDTLEDSVAFLDEEINLPDDSFFGKDKDDVKEEIDEFLDELFIMLELSKVVELRETYGELEKKIDSENNEISELKKEQVFAPAESESSLSKIVPDSKYTDTIKQFIAETKGDYEKIIQIKGKNIKGYEEELDKIAVGISEALLEKNINMDPEQLKVWLSSAIGDDIISMSVVFSHIKDITLQLEELTATSGENLSYAKKYYGMVVMLHKLIVYMQKKFIDDVENNIKPKLRQFNKEANSNLKEAKKLFRKDKKNQVLKSNIEANKMTIKAINLYLDIVNSQQRKIKKALKISKEQEKIALNTYKTVKLSSMVSALINNGLKTFDTLSKLQIPDMAKFENKEIQEQFRKLTMRISLSS
tara:strand:- start:3665 stop:4816 length:1152 start_codon:yes stop_codon:yes gene_type:complete